MTADRLAELLRGAYPDAEPSELDPATLEAWVAGAGADPDDHALVGAALVAWERLIVS